MRRRIGHAVASCVLLCTSAAVLSAGTQDGSATVIVRVTVSLQIYDDETRPQMLNRAMRMAKEQAVKNAFQADITAMNVVLGNREIVNWTQQHAEGLVTDCRLVQGSQSISLEAYSAQYDVSVARSAGVPDRSFAIDLVLGRARFRPGEALSLAMTATVDAFLHVFSLTDHGQVIWLSDDYPTGVPALAGQPLRYPHPRDGSLSLDLPTGLNRQSEAVWVIGFRRKPTAIVGPAVWSQLSKAVQGFPIADVFRELSRFARDEWSQQVVAYEIIR